MTNEIKQMEEHIGGKDAVGMVRPLLEKVFQKKVVSGDLSGWKLVEEGSPLHQQNVDYLLMVNGLPEDNFIVTAALLDNRNIASGAKLVIFPKLIRGEVIKTESYLQIEFEKKLEAIINLRQNGN